jgi:hypothetical protein
MIEIFKKSGKIVIQDSLKKEIVFDQSGPSVMLD